MKNKKITALLPHLFIILLINSLLSLGASSRYRINVTLEDIERKGAYGIMKLYNDEMCIKEIPFFISLHRGFYQDKRLAKGYRLVLRKNTIQSLEKKSASLHSMMELEESLIYKLDSLILYKLRKNRYRKYLCNFIAHVDSGAYEIPKTGAKIVVPSVIKGSVYYNKKNITNKMTVYFHTSGIKLKLPRYAKTISLGLLSDMDIGIAELEFIKESWVARLLYVKSKDNPKRKGWSFSMTKCNKIRPYSK